MSKEVKSDEKPFYPCDPEELADYIVRAFAHGDVEKAIKYMEERADDWLPGPYVDSWKAAIRLLRSRVEYF